MLKHALPQNIHFIGIGGIGMSGIALVLSDMDCKISGSDTSNSPILESLRKKNIRVYNQHQSSNIDPKINVVVYSNAIKSSNPELQKAQELGISCISRSQILNIIAIMHQPIAIAGTHGKTTSSAMLTHILINSKKDPSFIIGGIITQKLNAHLGKDPYFIYEACEAFGSINDFTPDIACVLNIDLDHMDYYSSLEDLKQTFLNYINRTPFYGLAILNGDDKNIQGLIPAIKKPFYLFGLNEAFSLHAKNIIFDSFFSTMDIVYNKKTLGSLTLNVPGIYNIYNALASIGISLKLNISFQEIKEALSKFKSPLRRFENRGFFNKALLIDDYAHHPTEIKTVIETALNMKKTGSIKRLIIAFQPHLYSRTKEHHLEIAQTLSLADYVISAPIYKAREGEDLFVPLSLITNIWDSQNYRSYDTADSLKEVAQKTSKILQEGDLFMTMGAGDINTVMDLLHEKI